MSARDHQELMEALHEVSALLNTGLDRQSLRVLVNLCEAGVNPEALAAVVQELRKEAAKAQQQQQKPQPPVAPATRGFN